MFWYVWVGVLLTRGAPTCGSTARPFLLPQRLFLSRTTPSFLRAAEAAPKPGTVARRKHARPGRGCREIGVPPRRVEWERSQSVPKLRKKGPREGRLKIALLPIALTIAGSDPSGGAGLQADLKTFQQFGVYGMSVVTLLTVQNTQRVSSVDPLVPSYVTAQLEAVTSDMPPAAAKTGALGSTGVIEAVAAWARGISFPLVVDPVMVSKHGAPLLQDEAREVLVRLLLPQASLLTPNLPEASALAAVEVTDLPSMEDAARRIADLGPSAVLVKGGHLIEDAVDVLYREGRMEHFTARRIASHHTHGTGCTYSAAITAGLAHGQDLSAAVRAAKEYITRAIATAPGLGHGCGPVNHASKEP